jgi:hypothetical protein
MPNYSRNDFERAAYTVERLFRGQPVELEGDRDMVVSDIEENTREFLVEMDFLDRFKIGIPVCLIDKDKVPISLAVCLNIFSRVPYRFQFEQPAAFWPPDALASLLRDAFQKPLPMGMDVTNRERAQDAFMRRAAESLATRSAAVRKFWINEKRSWHEPSLLNIRQWLGGPQISTPGCAVTVTTNSRGLRVFWSGAHYVTSNYFNSPTTPTSSVLQSGTYIFGVDGGAYGSHIQWDFHAVLSLPSSHPPSVHLNY